MGSSKLLYKLKIYRKKPDYILYRLILDQIPGTQSQIPIRKNANREFLEQAENQNSYKN